MTTDLSTLRLEVSHKLSVLWLVSSVRYFTFVDKLLNTLKLLLHFWSFKYFIYFVSLYILIVFRILMQSRSTANTFGGW